jgi:hypothetical protein
MTEDGGRESLRLSSYWNRPGQATMTSRCIEYEQLPLRGTSKEPGNPEIELMMKRMSERGTGQM